MAVGPAHGSGTRNTAINPVMKTITRRTDHNTTECLVIRFFETILITPSLALPSPRPPARLSIREKSHSTKL